MKHQRDLELRLSSLDTLGEAISAMKSLSAHHLRVARAALAPSRAYREGLMGIAARTGALLPGGEGGAGLLVLGAELGLCGGYNSHIVAAALEHRRALGAGPTLCVGRRAAALLSRRGVTADRVWPAPSVVREVPRLLMELAHAMLELHLVQGLAAMSSRFEGVGTFPAVPTTLLPIAVPAPSAPLAPRYATAERIVDVVVRELLYIDLHSLLLDAVASEHGARLVATGAAERWLDTQRSLLRRSLAAARREESTQEVIEIAAGARGRKMLRASS